MRPIELSPFFFNLRVHPLPRFDRGFVRPGSCTDEVAFHDLYNQGLGRLRAYR